MIQSGAKFAGPLEEPAQNGCGVKRAPQRNSEFLRCLGARIRRLCALRNSRTTDSPAAAKSAEFLFCVVPRTAACALSKIRIFWELIKPIPAV